MKEWCRAWHWVSLDLSSAWRAAKGTPHRLQGLILPLGILSDSRYFQLRGFPEPNTVSILFWTLMDFLPSFECLSHLPWMPGKNSTVIRSFAVISLVCYPLHEETIFKTFNCLSLLGPSCTIEINKNRNTQSTVSWGRFSTELSVALNYLFCNGRMSNEHILPRKLIFVYSENSFLIPLNI